MEKNRETAYFVFYNFIDDRKEYARCRCTACGAFVIGKYIDRSREVECQTSFVDIHFCSHCGAEDISYTDMLYGRI